MPISTTARAKSRAAQNENQGGGDKKAGSARAVNVAMRIAFQERGLPQPMSFMMAPASVSRATGRGIGWRFGER
jgi:hypothetical protein